MLDGRQTGAAAQGRHPREAVRRHGAAEFLLFPTVAHSHAERVRPEHRDLLATGGRRQHRRPAGRAGGGESRCGSCGQPAGRPRRAIEDLHIWTADSVRGRPAGLPAQAPAGGAGGAGRPAGRAGPAGPHCPTTRAARVGCGCRCGRALGEPVYDEASLRETIDRVCDAVE